jgi:hypothetical protein
MPTKVSRRIDPKFLKPMMSYFIMLELSFFEILDRAVQAILPLLDVLLIERQVGQDLHDCAEDIVDSLVNTLDGVLNEAECARDKFLANLV